MTKTISSRERLSHPPQSPSGLISAQQHSDEVNNCTDKESTTSPAQPTLGDLRIVHATPGRVRIRATDGSHNSIINSICQQLGQLEGIKEVTANQQTSSLIVTFDENKLPLSQVLAVIEAFGIQQQNTSFLASHTDPFAPWKSLDFWKEQGISFIPLFTGLGVTGALGITGLASIPVYMITANATRRVIDYIQPQSSAPKNHKQSNTVSATKHNVQSEAALEKVEQTTAIKQEIFTTNTVDKAKDLKVQPAKINYSIVHTVPGRIRLHVPRIAGDRTYARRLERLLKTDPQVTNVRVNPDAVSVMIAYQPSDIPVSRWVNLMQLAAQAVPQVISIKTTEPVQAEVTQLVEPEELTTQPQAEQVIEPRETQQLNTATEEATPEIAPGLWVDFKSPALSYALAFVANFPLKVGPD